MTEYWKSYAKKYCDVCKCWITDNKASVQFHENGKRHKENVTKKINELVKKATKEGKEKKELDEDMRKMEEAALKAYMKDVEVNPDHSAQLVKDKWTSKEDSSQPETSSSSNLNKKKDVKNRSRNNEEENSENLPKCTLELSSDRIWFEALTDDGTSYYWNTQTNESVWDPPDGFVSLSEQNKDTEKLKDETEDSETNKQDEDNEKLSDQNKEEDEGDEDEDEVKEEALPAIGPMARGNPYGAWTTVVPEKKKPVDLQLPPSYQPLIQPAAYTVVEPKVKIKEKTIDPTKLNSVDGPTNFKRRKIANRGNARQRFNDDNDSD